MTDTPHKQASAWWVGVQSGAITDEQRAGLERWRLADPAHESAWQDVALGWAVAGDLKNHEEVRRWRGTPSRPAPRDAKLLWLGAGIAAALLLTVTLQSPAMMQWVRPVERTYATHVGEVETLSLADGSRVTLDADSAIVSTIGPGTRSILLRRGRARFDVVHDTRRPFTVTAQSTRVLATGTKFDVDKRPDAVDVALIRGGVEVRDIADPRRVVRLRPGQHALNARGLELVASPSDPVVQEGWLRGQLYFNNDRLADVVTQMNRYGQAQLVIAEAPLADMRVSGVFDARDTRGFAEALRSAGIARTLPGDGASIRLGVSKPD